MCKGAMTTAEQRLAARACELASFAPMFTNEEQVLLRHIAENHGKRELKRRDFTDADKARALEVYRRRGFMDTLESGEWTHATLARWVGEWRRSGVLTEQPPRRKQALKPKEPKPVKQVKKKPPKPPAPEKPKPVFPDLGPIPTRKFDPDEVCRSQAAAQREWRLT